MRRRTWWLPVLVFLVAVVLPGLVFLLIAAVVAAVVLALVTRRPVVAVQALIVVMPFHQAVMAWLYNLGIPEQLVRPLGQWKEVLILGLVLTAGHRVIRQDHRLDRIDALALGFVGLAFVYLLMPRLFAGGTLGETLSLATRMIGFRTEVLYVLLLWSVRHLRFSSDERRSVVQTFLWVGTVVSVIAFIEIGFQDLWATIWLDWIDLPTYRIEVLDQPVATASIFTSPIDVAGRDLVRAGSVFLLPYALGCYGAMCVALLGARLLQGAARRLDVVMMVITGAAVLLSITRTATLALVLVIAGLLLKPTGEPRRTAEGTARRTRLTLLLGLLLLFAIPAAFRVGIVDRFQGKDEYSSSAEHRSKLDEAIDSLGNHPLGTGLATAAGAGQREGVVGAQITESQYMQVGVQLGVLGLVLWVALIVLTLREFGRPGRWRSLGPPDQALIQGTGIGFFALFIACATLQIYIEFALAWPVWILAGLALSAVDAAARDEGRTAVHRRVMSGPDRGTPPLLAR